MRRVEIGLGKSLLRDTKAAVTEAIAQAKAKLTGTPGLALVSSTVEHDKDVFLTAFRETLPNVPISGITTSLGILGADGITSSAEGVVAVLLFSSPSGTVTFAAGGALIDGSSRLAAKEAAVRAARLIEAKHPGKRPAVLLLTASPGAEEDILAGLADVFPGVPAYGGSAADHAIAGQWSTFSDAGALQNGVAVAALFGDIQVGGAFVAPYDATNTKAVVTAAEGRTIKSIDGKKAAQVLSEWVGDKIADQVENGGVVLAQTALSPLALRRTVGGLTHDIPTHPFQIIQPEGSVGVFALPAVGDTLCLLKGTVDGLTGNLDVLVTKALEDGKLTPDTVCGGLLIYCAGCAGAVGGELHEALKKYIGKHLPDAPVLGLCTFGEQGYVPGLGNAHHNLSLSLVLFG